MTAMRRIKLHFNCWIVGPLCLSTGLDYQTVVGWGHTKQLPSNWNLKYDFFILKEKVE